MRTFALSFLALALSASIVRAQTETPPTVIAKMEALGTLYLTQIPIGMIKKGEPKSKAPHRIIGVDFRPMAGTDPKKIVAVLRELAALPDVETLLLLGMSVTDEAADAIPASDKIKSIQFYNTNVTDAAIAKLARFKSLASFNFTGSGLSDDGMKSLAKINTLQTVIITDAAVTDEGVLALRTMTSLRRLVIENSAATEPGIDHLRKRLPGLVSGERFLK